MERKCLEEAQQLMFSSGKKLDRERLPLMECVGRILAEDVCANVNQPPFPRSAMDGYAVKSADIEGAGKASPVSLSVIYKTYAGEKSQGVLASGQAVRIMTGAAVPEGADCVIQQESTDYGEDVVSIFQSGKAGENVCPMGEDFHKGERLLEKGIFLNAVAIGVAAAAGVRELSVYRQVRAAVISTGDELCSLEKELEEGKIYDSNRAYFTARCQELGWAVVHSCGAGDDIENIKREIGKAKEQADIILTTGGVSVGQKDLLPEVMPALGAEVIFHGMSLKPGHPTMLSVLDKVPVLSLSGNPNSASVVFEVLVPAFIAKCLEKDGYEMRKKEAVCQNEFPKRSKGRRILRAYEDDGCVWLSEYQRNGQTRNGLGCNCLVDVPAGNEGIYQGDKVNVLKL